MAGWSENNIHPFPAYRKHIKKNTAQLLQTQAGKQTKKSGIIILISDQIAINLKEVIRHGDRHDFSPEF